MKNPRAIIRANNVAILPQSGSTFEITGMVKSREGFRTIFDESNRPKYVEENWYDDYIQIGDYKISPNGIDNLFPIHFKKLIDGNNIVHGLLREKVDLLMAGGTRLYKEIKEGHDIIKDYMLDPEIEDWLESWDFDTWLLEQVTDFMYVENNATLMIPNRFSRLTGFESQRRISELRYLPIEDIRMEPLQDGMINHYFQSNWYNPEEITKYPAFDKRNPFEHRGSLFFVKMPTFGSKYYGRPPFIGAVNWVELASLIPYWHKDNLKNAQFKWHIESSFDYWEAISKQNNWGIDSKEMIEYENQMLESIDTFLASETAENAQKRFHSKFGFSEFGNKEKVSGWKITALQDNTEKNSKAYLGLYEHSNEAIVSSMALDQALSNIRIKGSLSSGLDKLIAFNMHQIVSTPTPRRLILSPVNAAIKINWPGKNIKIGFPDIQLDYADKNLHKEKVSIEDKNQEE